MTLQAESLTQPLIDNYSTREPEPIIARLMTEHEVSRTERDALIESLLGNTAERNREALVTEIETLAKLYEGRSVERYPQDGSRVLCFATRFTGGSETFLDDIYIMKRTADGKVSLQADFMRYEKQGYRIHIPAAGRVQTSMFDGASGPIFVSGGDRERECMRDFIARSLDTAQIVLDRWEKSPAVARLADDQTRAMTEAYLDSQGIL